MSPPPGLVVPKGHVCKLNRSLYGLKQAARQWNHKLTSVITKNGFLQSQNDHSLFIKSTSSTLTFLLVYVDDIIISGNNQAKIDSLKTYLQSNFKLKDLGNLKFFLGIEYARNSKEICINQRKYAMDIISDC